MVEGRDTQGKWLKGRSANPRGRPRGVIDRRQRMQKALGEGADAIIAVVKSKALEGDMQAAGLVMARLVPTLKAEGVLVRFALDASLPTSKQFAQVSQAIADGQLTVEEAKQVAEIIKLQAEALTSEGGGENAAAVIDSLKRFAQRVEGETSVPYTHPRTTTPAAPSDTGVCPPAPK